MCETIYVSPELENVNIMISFGIIAATIAVLIYQRIHTKVASQYILTQFTCINNIALCFYSCILSLVSLLYGSNYILYETKWLSTTVCAIVRMLVVCLFFMAKFAALLLAVNQLIATKYALRYEPLNARQCRLCLLLGLLVITVSSGLLMLIEESKVRDIYCYPFEVVTFDWKFVSYLIYFAVLLLMLITIFVIHVCIFYHVENSSKRITSTLKFDDIYWRLVGKSIIVIGIESITWIFLLVSAICHNIEDINRQLRTALILVTIYIRTLSLTVNYAIQRCYKTAQSDLCKHCLYVLL